jgi:4-hydroxythreonine-4-phosphate dehydrogenase
MKKIAISIGDINGIGIQLALENHKKIKKLCDPIYCIDKDILNSASKKLNITIPKDFKTYGKYNKVKIRPGEVHGDSGKFSYNSFKKSIFLTQNGKVDAICTLPINKEAWLKADIMYVGHTDMLRDIFKKDAIMMLGCKKMYVALYTEHTPLKEVPKEIKTKKIIRFLTRFYKSIKSPNEKIAVLGLNPHAGDNGVLGDEEEKIKRAIKRVNKILYEKYHFIEETFELVVPDIAFTPYNRRKFRYYCAMYHDQGLAPLKALYFDESINVSLNLPIIRTSVDHGTAFDLAYQNNNKLSSLSYINAIKEAIDLSK